MGKTGTGKDNTAWYTGFYEIKNKKIYFAIHLDDNTKNGIVGAEAKEIANNIIDRYYRSDMWLTGIFCDDISDYKSNRR